MLARRRYDKKTRPVVAVQLNLETAGFTFQKWGHEQRCKAGDWVVDNGGDVYTVDAKVFADTYSEVSPGLYQKTKPVWAEQAESAGTIETQEGATDYGPGDYVVFNDESGRDGYAVSKDAFEAMYEEAPAGEGEGGG